MQRQASTISTDHGVLRLCRRLLGYSARRPAGSVLLLVLLAAKSGFDLLKPWPMKLLVDNVLDGNPLPQRVQQVLTLLPGAATPQGLLAWCIAGTLAVFIIGWGLTIATTLVGIGFGQRMVYDVAADLFGHLQKLSHQFHARRSPGELMRRVTGDTACVATIIRDALLPIIAATVSLVSLFFVMWRLSPVMTVLAIAVAPMMIMTLRWYARPMMQTSCAQFDAEGRLYEVVHDSLAAAPLVQTFAREDYGENRLRQSASAALAAAVTATGVQLRFKVLIGLSTAIGTAAILSIGAQQVLSGQLSVGVLLVFMAYLASLYGPLEAIMYTSSMVESAAGSAKRVVEILETAPDVKDRPGARKMARPTGHVRFEDVHFGYDGIGSGKNAVLRGVSLEASPGELIAIVGRSGSGKSTLLNLLPRMFDPDKGRVMIDGDDLRDVTLASLRQHVAIVQQEPFLFPTTIAQNIAYGRPDASDADIQAAARLAHVHEFIQGLPHGYDTVVGDRGATLSGGERQRLAIARAVLKDSPILVLDEPTSSLDAQTEQLVMQALSSVTKGRSVLVIAHRLATVRRANRIYVLDAGRIVESGTHAELLRAGGSYATLHFLQESPGAGAGRELH